MNYTTEYAYFGITCTLAATILLLKRYAHKDIHISILAITGMGWLLGFSIIAILPVDIYVTLHS